MMYLLKIQPDPSQQRSEYPKITKSFKRMINNIIFVEEEQQQKYYFPKKRYLQLIDMNCSNKH